MTALIASIDTFHEDMIHDVQFDYYGRKLATCSSDRIVKVFDIQGENYVQTAELKFHEGPVWQVAWAHPRFGVILASCSYDGAVFIYKETAPNTFSILHEHKVHNSSVNSISWAPHEFGLILACASSDGTVSLLEFDSGIWKTQDSISVSRVGVNSVSWAPYTSLGSSVSVPSSDPSQPPSSHRLKRLVTASCDSLLRVWREMPSPSSSSPSPSLSGPSSSGGRWEQEEVNASLSHSDWVRDASWCPNTSLPYNLLASCSEDRSVLLWTQQPSSPSSSMMMEESKGGERGGGIGGGGGGVWSAQLLKKFSSPVWRVSWSVDGTLLSVSTGENQVSIWKQSTPSFSSSGEGPGAGVWVEITSNEEMNQFSSPLSSSPSSN